MSKGSTSNIRLGISTCPNDTFAFHALIHKKIDWRGLNFEIELLDIQQLNDRLFAGDFDVAKASFHAAFLLAQSCVVLPSGSALGFGVGPLLLASRPNERPLDTNQVTLCPGKHTTAMLLFQIFHPNTTRIEQAIFSDIMPRLINKQADFGVCIHEGRFTWQDQNLSLVEDLGTRWEATTGAPLPLGGIIARRSLGDELIGRIQAVIRDSIDFALADRDAALPTMRQYAQEFNDDVLMKHVDLYVNQWTQDLGDVGTAALQRLSEEAHNVGIIRTDHEAIDQGKPAESVVWKARSY
jgi:1,4-dihydroxy-6-naphthoate synthase